mgnify:FL=1
MEHDNQKNSKYKISERYNKGKWRVVKYTHKNGTETYRLFYKGKSENQTEIMQSFYQDQEEIMRALQGKGSRGETLENYLGRTENVEYVDNLGSANGQGIILGAYIPARDKLYVRRDIPERLIQLINERRASDLERIIGNESYKHKKRISQSDIIKFARTHELVHRRRMYTGESQDEEEVDLEAAIINGEYPIIRFPTVLQRMNDPYTKEETLKREGIDYIRQAA